MKNSKFSRFSKVFILLIPFVLSCGQGMFSPCSSSDIQTGNCGCQIRLPVDTTGLTPSGGTTVWPWGVHGQSGHQEGHPGFDFISATSINVYAVADGYVSKVEAGAADEYVASSKTVYVKADCGIIYDYQPVSLDASIALGSRVTAGQKIGVMSEMVAPYGPGRFSFHFDTRGEPGSFAYTSACPGNFLSTTDFAALQALIDSSTYDEKTARTVSIACKSGSSQSFTYPAENKVCNAHLDSATAATLNSCLQLGSTRPVW